MMNHNRISNYKIIAFVGMMILLLLLAGRTTGFFNTVFASEFSLAQLKGLVNNQTATIEGKLTFPDGSPIPDVAIIAYGPDNYQQFSTTTLADGTFKISVRPGRWEVEPEILGSEKFEYAGDPILVELEKFGSIDGVNLEVIELTSTISGAFVYPDGEVALVDGRLSAYPGPGVDNGHGAFEGNGNDVVNGRFEIPILPGRFQLISQVGFQLKSRMGFFVEQNVEVTVDENGNSEVEIKLLPPTHTIVGRLVDARSGEVVDIIRGMVSAVSETNGTNAEVGSDGQFKLDVIPGLWRLEGYELDFANGTTRIAGEQFVEVTAQSSPTITVDIPIYQDDSQIRVEGLDPTGAPVDITQLYLTGIGELKDEAFVIGLERDEEYRIVEELAHGTYLMDGLSYYAFLQDDNQPLWPESPLEVTIAKGEMNDVELNFVESDANLELTFFAEGLSVNKSASIYLSREDMGHFVTWPYDVNLISNGVDAQGTISIPLVDGNWKIESVVYGYNYSGEKVIAVSGDTNGRIELFPSSKNDKNISAVVETEATSFAHSNRVFADVPAGAIMSKFAKKITLATSRFNFHDNSYSMLGRGYFLYSRWFISGSNIDTPFDIPIRITIPYNDIDLGNVAPADIRVMGRLKGESETFLIESEVNTELQIVTFVLDRQIEFALVGPNEDVPTFRDIFAHSYYAPFTAR